MFFASNFFFQDLIAKLVFKRPEKPIDFLVKEMEVVKRNGTEKSKENKPAWWQIICEIYKNVKKNFKL